MNRDSDITKTILLRLLLEPDSGRDGLSGDPHLTDPTTPDGLSPIADPGDASPSGAEPRPPSASPGLTSGQGYSDSYRVDPPIGADPNAVFDPGDLPIVETHFEAVLKRRLKQEISQRPPLFPWEKDLQDYPDALNPDLGLATVWLNHLRSLPVPTELPDDVLSELLSQCQQVADRTTQIGRRLILAVESLFPDQPQILDTIARAVARPAYRSGSLAQLEVDYGNASTQQQVALAMLAASSIFEALSLTVSATAPDDTRTWLTAAGPLTLTATYASAPVPRLNLQVDLPQTGAITLLGGGESLHADRATPGCLMAQVDAPQAGTLYTLEVSLGEEAALPLRFQIRLTD